MGAHRFTDLSNTPEFEPFVRGDYKTDNEVLAFVRENGFPNATILPEDQP
jgi:hypothetical protein